MALPIRRDGPPPHVAVYQPPRRDDAPAIERGRFYRRAAWRKCRAYKLSLNPLCELCLQRDQPTEATQVHHVVDYADRPDLAYELSNLQALCAPCHSKITASKGGGRWRRGAGNQRRPS